MVRDGHEVDLKLARPRDQKFLGHRDPRSVERYARLSDQALVDVIGLRAGPGDVGGRVRRRQAGDGGCGLDES